MWTSKLLYALAVLAGLYAVLVGALYAMQRPMVFRSDLSPPPPAPGGVPDFEEASYRTEDGLDLRALHRPAAPGRPTLVYFHGNADGLTGSLRVTRGLAAAGYGLLLATYRGYDGNPGRPSEAGFYADARAALDWLTRRGVPPSAAVAAGNSLGSGPATEVAAALPLAGLVLISGYTSLPDVAAGAYPFVPVRLLMRDRFDNLGKIGRVTAPVLVLHGTADGVIPFGHAAALAAAAGERARLVPFAGRGHELVGDPALSPVIEGWLAEAVR